MSATDDELLTRARGGDREAFAELVARHGEKVRRFTATMVRGDEEDIFQATVEVALGELARFEGRSAFSTWLCGIALNLCRRRLREGKKTVSLEDETPARRGVLTSICRRELSERLDLAIDRLPIALREAFALHYLNGLPFSEVGTLTGVSEGTARVRAHRARALLKTELGEALDLGENPGGR